MFLLLLMGLGAAGVKAQVRIGGNGAPNAAAVLDLNATDATTGTKTLALPRVSLTSATDLLGNASLLTGMLVYNTSGSLSTGVYYWSGTNWERVDAAVSGGDTIVGNEITDATPNGGLIRSGAGTASNPYTLGLAPETGLSVTPTNTSVVSTPVTWTLVWSGNLSWQGHPGLTVYAEAQGVNVYSFCIAGDSGTIVVTGSAAIRLQDLLNRYGTLSTPVRCYAPSA